MHRRALSSRVRRSATTKITEDGRCFGYIAETEHYRYCLRCTPSPGEYQGYLYSYDLRQQRMAQQAKPVGRITYASGEEQTFTDAQKYLDTIREELPYQATTGFRYETLTDDPAVRKAVDDILLDFAGEENPRRGCNYGLTEAGKQALREAADPDRPHTYAWFVMTDCNIPGEQIYRDLTLEEAIRTYLDSDRPEKRLGVTKDGIATVDLVRSLNGEQHFFTDHLQLDSFKRDPEIAAAVKTLRLELEQNTPQQGITIGGLSVSQRFGPFCSLCFTRNGSFQRDERILCFQFKNDFSGVHVHANSHSRNEMPDTFLLNQLHDTIAEFLL